MKLQKSSQLPPSVAAQVLTPAQQREMEADSYIQRAIELHENNQLEEATYYFRLAAQGENPVGQLMYGLSLRHGWGCKPDPKVAIVYLERAAAYAMSELKDLIPGSSANIQAIQQQRQQQQQQSPPPQQQQQQQQQQPLKRMGTIDRKSAMLTARRELVMALYELGMSFLKGWGVQRNKVIAFHYFKLAADLGDADSQNETALCFLDGVGIEKNPFEAARYYRLAEAQGNTQFGNSWIWKPKYDQYCEQYAVKSSSSTSSSTSNKGNNTSTSSSSNPSNLVSLMKNMPERKILKIPDEPGRPSGKGRYNIAGDLISSSQLELKIKQAEKLTHDTISPKQSTAESPTSGKKKHRWSLWDRSHRRSPSST
ncbi:hypothetical protein BGZ76_005338 [Entomortierella beljakovae]|nr:hypothetical protein BGZ76_005338 [Entomortierella beljakovae]